ncbi:MAG TPA: DinB family protein [Vicinamibacterales bacterium]|jgi:uncharacterized damage-inducible protein DinB
MDREPARLANHIMRTVTGPTWHGPSLAQVLEGVTAKSASERPIPDAHTIWEIVLHVSVWAEIARARLHGDRMGDPTPQEDWPAVGSGDADWKAALDRLEGSHRALAHAVRNLDEQTLAAKLAGLDYSASTLLRGVVEHGTYHGGQIALLAKALKRSGA